jgi:enoyl-CoA hydratase/carnithine racemase
LSEAGPGLVERSVDAGVHVLRLARPPVNALDPALCVALREAVEVALAEGAEGLVLAGGPKVFSAGLDVPHLVSLGDDRQALRTAWEAFFDAARALAGSPVPVAAAIAGHAPAGGCVLALCCDHRVMARSPEPDKPFLIGLNETRVGLAVPAGIADLMRRTVGARRAERMLVAGDMLDGDAALAAGLVDEVVEPDAVLPRATAWLRGLLQLPRQPMLGTRALLRADLQEAVSPRRLTLETFLDQWQQPDTQAALRALVARLGK